MTQASRQVRMVLYIAGLLSSRAGAAPPQVSRSVERDVAGAPAARDTVQQASPPRVELEIRSSGPDEHSFGDPALQGDDDGANASHPANPAQIACATPENAVEST